MLYREDSLKVEQIREGQEYDGVRITLIGMLHNARIPLQIDVGFGDAITPAPDDIEYPTLLEAPAPKLRGYPRYALLAEKFEAMVQLGLANSRMKDFYDVWLLSRLFSFDGDLLGNAITNTFSRRGTALPTETPFALTEAFSQDWQKQVQWDSFIRKSKPAIQPNGLALTIAEISKFLLPVLVGLQNKASFNLQWSPESGWSQKQS